MNSKNTQENPKENTAINNDKTIFEIVTLDRPGILARISNIISSRWIGIKNLSTTLVNEKKGLYRILISSDKMEKTKRLQMFKQFSRIVPVMKVTELEENQIIQREIALVKIIGDADTRSQTLALAENYRAYPIDLRGNALVFEIQGTSDSIDKFIREMSHLGLTEYSRSGTVAINRGEVTIFDDLDPKYKL